MAAAAAPEEQENFFQNIGAAASSHAEGSQVGGIGNDGLVAAETDGLTEIENTLCVQCGATPRSAHRTPLTPGAARHKYELDFCVTFRLYYGRSDD